MLAIDLWIINGDPFFIFGGPILVFGPCGCAWQDFVCDSGDVVVLYRLFVGRRLIYFDQWSSCSHYVEDARAIIL